MVRAIASLLGILLITLAVLGFMPEFNQGGKLLGSFAINSLSNIMHLVTGVIALMCGLKSSKASVYFFLVLGFIYGTMAILGFYDSTLALFHYIVADGANNIFHALISVIALYLGFSYLRKS